MKEVRHKTTEELAKMLGIKSYDANRLSMQYIFDNVSPKLRPKIKAAIELYKRSCNEVPQSITNTSAAIAVVRPLLMDLDQEEVWAIMLNSALHVIDKVKITTGSINSSMVDVNGVCRNALLSKASCVILAHNHPSGSPAPSESDINETRRLKNALKTIDVMLIDHIIVSKGGDAYSYAEEMTLKNEMI